MGYSPWGHKESDTTEQLHFTLEVVQLLSLQPCSWFLGSHPLRHILGARGRTPSSASSNHSHTLTSLTYLSVSKEEELSEKTLIATCCEYCMLSAFSLGDDPKVKKKKKKKRPVGKHTCTFTMQNLRKSWINYLTTMILRVMLKVTLINVKVQTLFFDIYTVLYIFSKCS